MRQKGFAPLLIFFILVILGTVGYIAYKNIKITNQPITSNTPPSILENIPVEHTGQPNSKSDQSTLNGSYDVGNKLIGDMKSVNNVPETIPLSNGSVLNLYKFVEEKVNPHCDKTNLDESCKLEPIFGDYSEAGFNCLGNPFYNPLNPSVNKLGYYNGEDADMNYIPMISSNYYILKSGNYELFTGSQYGVFLLKDNNNRCHPYKLKIGYFQKGIPPSDSNTLSAVRFNLSDPVISSTNYSDNRFGCNGSSTRVVETDKTLLNYLDKVAEIGNGVIIYSLKSNINYNYDDFSQFNFVSSVTENELQDGGYALLSIKLTSDSDLAKQKAFLTKLSANKSVIFVSDPLFPDVVFVYISFENLFYPGC